MALLTYAYDPAKQTAWVSQIIEAANQARARRDALEAETEARDKARQQAAHEAEMQDARRAYEFDRKMNFDTAKEAFDQYAKMQALNSRERVAGMRAGGRAAAGQDSFPMLPEGDAPAGAPDSSSSLPADDSAPLQPPATGDTLNLLANQAEGENLPAMSLEQPSPFQNTTDFAGVPSAPDDTGDVLQASDGTAVPAAIAPMANSAITPSAGASLLTAANPYGGGPYDNTEAAAPANPGSIKNEPSLMPDSIPSESPAVTGVLDAAARARVNTANQYGGPKAARTALQRELAIAAKPQKTSAADGSPVIWEGDTAFTKGGKAYRYDESGSLQPVTRAPIDPPEVQIEKDGFKPVGKPGYENVVTNKDGTALQVWSRSANGRVSYKPYTSASKIEHVGDKIVRVMPDNSVVTLATADKIANTDQVGLTESMRSVAKAQDEVEAAKLAQGDFFSARRMAKAGDALMSAHKEVAVYVKKYPFLLNEPVGQSLPADLRKNIDDKVPVVSPDGKPGKIPRSQLQSALGLGYKQQ